MVKLRIQPIFGVLVVLVSNLACAQSQFAPGFQRLPADAKVVLMPVDVRIFEVGMPGIPEPRPKWSNTAKEQIYRAYLQRAAALRMHFVEVPTQDEALFTELLQLHDAVAGSIAVHHFGKQRLASKKGALDWNIGVDTTALQQKTGAHYALFTSARDVRWTAARELITGGIALHSAVMIGAPVVPGGQATQVARVSLIDLATGQVVWVGPPLIWSTRHRGLYDFREEDQARELVNFLLEEFPR